MKRIFCTLLTACILLGGLCALPASAADVPAAVPADHEPRTIHELTGRAASIRTSKAMVTKFCTPYLYAPSAVRTPADQSGAEPAEGAVAVLRVYTTYHPKDTPINTDGHAFLSVSNVSDGELEIGGLMLAPCTGITVGTRGNRPEHAGLWYNLESYYVYYLPDFYPNRRCIQVSLNQEQLDTVNAALAASDKWSAVNNCVTFVSSVWNTVCSDQLHPLLPTPEELTVSMNRYEGKVTVDPDVPYDYIVYYGYPAVPSQDYR